LEIQLSCQEKSANSRISSRNNWEMSDLEQTHLHNQLMIQWWGPLSLELLNPPSKKSSLLGSPRNPRGQQKKHQLTTGWHVELSFKWECNSQKKTRERWETPCSMNPLSLQNFWWTVAADICWLAGGFSVSRRSPGSFIPKPDTLWLCQNSYWQWPLISWVFPARKWWFSIVFC
jgi:hypothetical protein